jgi:hypothetical protein
VAGAGDVDGVAGDELIAGAYAYTHNGDDVGAAFVFSGPLSGLVSAVNADAILVGEEDGDKAGYAVDGAGDVNGDGYADLLVGAYGNDDGGSLAGKVYLVYGPVSGTVFLASADARFLPLAAGDELGSYVAGVGDTNGDGLDDILIGAHEASSGKGEAYLFWGTPSGQLSVADANARLLGENPDDFAGQGVAGAGDTDGDGLDDILIGAQGYDDVGNWRGIAYLLTGPVTCN